MSKDRVAVLMVREGKLLLMHRHKAGMEYYSVPGGKIEPGETPEETAMREVQEETSMTVVPASLRKLATLRNQDRTEHYYLAGRFKGQPVLGGPELDRQSPENHYELEWLDADRVAGVNLMPPAIRTMCAEIAKGIERETWSL